MTKDNILVYIHALHVLQHTRPYWYVLSLISNQLLIKALHKLYKQQLINKSIIGKKKTFDDAILLLITILITILKGLAKTTVAVSVKQILSLAEAKIQTSPQSERICKKKDSKEGSK